MICGGVAGAASSTRSINGASCRPAGAVDDAEALHDDGVVADVPDRESVEHDRAAAHPRLEAGDAAGAVHEHVGGGQQLAHAVGEAEDADVLAARERLVKLAANALVAAGDADDVRVGDRGRRLRGAGEVADAPAAARYDHDLCA